MVRTKNKKKLSLNLSNNTATHIRQPRQQIGGKISLPDRNSEISKESERIEGENHSIIPKRVQELYKYQLRALEKEVN